MTALRNDLRQRKPTGSLYQEAFLNLARTETVLRDGM